MIPLPTIAARVATTSIVSFPRTLEKLDMLCADEGTPVAVLSAVLSSDPLLSALILGQATAEAQASGLDAAIMQVGAATIRGLVRRATPIPGGARGPIASCWSLANACATMAPIVAEGVARHLRQPIDMETLTTAARLHDLGTALAMLHFPEEHQRAAARSGLGEAPYGDCLRREVGVGPQDLALILARSWRIPDHYTMVMRNVDRPTATASEDAPFHDLVAIIHVSRLLVRGVGFVAEGDPYLGPMDETVMNRWELGIPLLEQWLNQFYTDQELLELYESSLGH